MKRRDFIRKTAGVSLAAGVSPYFMAGNSKMLTSGGASTPGEKIKRFGDGRDWFFQKRFGMFIHWGLYAIPGWHEQHQWRGRIERADYMRLAKKWNPVKFDPERWLDLMEETGMKYICITTKHHDGFCLWDTKQTSFNTMNTPYGKDIIGILADACHKRDIPLSLYYSIADWNHENYPNQGLAHQLPPQPQDSPDWDMYLDFLKGQVRELCNNYGKIHGFWWDINRTEYRDTSINEMIRQLQPEAVINNRGFDDGDFGTPERDYNSDDSLAFDRPTEACQSVGIESWGYRKDEDFYTDRHLFRSIDRYLARDANYLLNVGPMADGTIPAESISVLKRTGKWYNAVKESLEKVVPVSALTSNRNVMITKRDNSLYVHLNKELPGNVVKLKPINIAPVKAILLNDGRAIDFAVRFSPSDHLEQKAYLNLINLPANSLSNTVMVIKLEFDRPVNELSRPDSPEDGQSGWNY